MCIRDSLRVAHPVRLLDDPDRAHHVLHQLRRRDREGAVSYTHLRAHETGRNLVCRLLLEKKKKKKKKNKTKKKQITKRKKKKKKNQKKKNQKKKKRPK